MKISQKLSRTFGPGPEFEAFISDFAFRQKLLPDPQALDSKRYLARSIAPHIIKLSQLFNRIPATPPADPEKKGKRPPRPVAVSDAPLEKYWNQSSHAANFRLAYFLYFMPANLMRIAGIWTELERLGYRWRAPSFKGIEFGAGPATGACGVAAGEAAASIGLPQQGNWALIEQDKPMLQLGRQWAQEFFASKEKNWQIRPFVRQVSPENGWLPERSPRFNLWLMSFFLNELDIPLPVLADKLLEAWDKHLEPESLIILCDSALKAQSRRLLELRKLLLEKTQAQKLSWFRVLLPCLGHQNCGALAEPEDWCHEEISWWRPPYVKKLDEMAKLDRKTLPFSYLVLAKSALSIEELLPKIQGNTCHRLVSPAHSEGKDLEFFLCGQEGKCRGRLSPHTAPSPEQFKELKSHSRGSILLGAQLRGDPRSTKIEKVKKIL